MDWLKRWELGETYELVLSPPLRLHTQRRSDCLRHTTHAFSSSPRAIFDWLPTVSSDYSLFMLPSRGSLDRKSLSRALPPSRPHVKSTPRHRTRFLLMFKALRCKLVCTHMTDRLFPISIGGHKGSLIPVSDLSFLSRTGLGTPVALRFDTSEKMQLWRRPASRVYSRVGTALVFPTHRKHYPHTLPGLVARWQQHSNRAARFFRPIKQVCRQHEKPLVLQLCRLVRGFTHPASYFAGEGESCSNARGDRVGGGRGDGEDLALFSVEEFSAEMVGVGQHMLIYSRFMVQYMRVVEFCELSMMHRGNEVCIYSLKKGASSYMECFLSG